jgi:hypothetical protein
MNSNKIMLKIMGVGLIMSGAIFFYIAYITLLWRPLGQSSGGNAFASYAWYLFFLSFILFFIGLDFLFVRWVFRCPKLLFGLLIFGSIFGVFVNFMGMLSQVPYSHNYEPVFFGMLILYYIALGITSFSLLSFLDISARAEELRTHPIFSEKEITNRAKFQFYLLFTTIFIFVIFSLFSLPEGLGRYDYPENIIGIHALIILTLGLIIIFSLYNFVHYQILIKTLYLKNIKMRDLKRFYLFMLTLIFAFGIISIYIDTYIETTTTRIHIHALFVIIFLSVLSLLVQSREDEMICSPDKYYAYYVDHDFNRVDINKTLRTTIITLLVSVVLILASLTVVNLEKELNDINEKIIINESTTPEGALDHFLYNSAFGEASIADYFWIYKINYDYKEFIEPNIIYRENNWNHQVTNTVYRESLTDFEKIEFQRIIGEVEQNEECVVTDYCLLQYTENIFNESSDLYFTDCYAGLEIDGRWFVSEFDGYRESVPQGIITSVKQTHYSEVAITFGNFTPEPRLCDLSLIITGENKIFEYSPLVRLNTPSFQNLSIVGFNDTFEVWPYGNYTVSMYYYPSHQYCVLSGQTNFTTNKWLGISP